MSPDQDFARFYREHLDVVLGFCYRRVGDAELAADVAAEVFAAALADRRGYSPKRGSARSWVLGIAAHKAADALRRGRVERRAQTELGMREIVWSDDDLERVLHVSTDRLDELLDALPEDQRAAVQARVIDQRDYDEIARDRGVSEQVVRKRVSRGLATMRRRWTKEPQ